MVTVGTVSRGYHDRRKREKKVLVVEAARSENPPPSPGKSIGIKNVICSGGNQEPGTIKKGKKPKVDK